MTAKRRKNVAAKTPEKAPAKPYEPTPRERVVLEKLVDHFRAYPSVKIEQKGSTSEISYGHPDQGVGQAMLMEAIGTKNAEFVTPFISLLVNAGRATHMGMNCRRKRIEINGSAS
jgi:hypothetical protein